MNSKTVDSIPELEELERGRPWFRFEDVAEGVVRIIEPYVKDFMQANMWLLRGARRDLLIDTGNGIASLRGAIEDMKPRNLLVIATHAHADHVGSLHEFDDVWAHASVARALEICDPDATLAEENYAIDDMSGLKVGPPRLAGVLASARPYGFDPAMFGPRLAKISRSLQDGDLIDTGDRTFRVLHLPGHSPGCMCLYDEVNRLLVAGDVIYDGRLVDDLHHSDRDAYKRSLRRLLDLDVDLVLAGHMAPFDGQRLHSLIAQYLGAR